MTHLRLLHGGLYVDHAALATEAFRNDRKARRVLLDLWEGRKPRQPIEWLIRPVLEYHTDSIPANGEIG